jgi:galactonate dehydratase
MTPLTLRRRSILSGLVGSAALLHGRASADEKPANPLIGPKDKLRITKLETFYVHPRWLFLKIHTDAGIVGLGDPTLENRTATCAAAVAEYGGSLIGKDPREVLTHWQAMYRGSAPYRSGPILTSAMSGIDQALWDIKGKALGMPVWKLMGGPMRPSIKLYWDTLTDPPERLQQKIKEGFTGFKAAPLEYAWGNKSRSDLPPRDTPAYMSVVRENIASLRDAIGPARDFAFHIGEASYRSCMELIKTVEPYHPMFVEIHGNNYEFDEMAEIARQTWVPIATGEDVYTKWGFRPILVKGAAKILQPDCSHAGGITEVCKIAAMADAFDVQIAPHNPLSPIDLAAAVQVAAVIPNFFALETSDRGIGDPELKGWPESWRGVDLLKKPFQVVNGALPLPQEPGLGIELDENALERHRTDIPPDK